MSKRPIKRYALDLVEELRRDVKEGRAGDTTYLDLAEVTQVKPQIVIEPHHTNAEYDDDYLIFNIDPDSLEVGDLVILGRDPSYQPIVLGIANAQNEDPFFSPEMKEFQQNTEYLRENTQHWKTSVDSDTDLPSVDNDDGDLRFSKDTNTIFRWDGDNEVWEATTGGGPAGNFVDESGDTMTGDLIMASGTSITLTDGPVNGTDAVNKAYVDALFALCCGGGGPILSITIDATDSPYVPDPSIQLILVDTTLGPVSITMPGLHIDGTIFEIKDKTGTANTNNITVTSLDGDLIDNSASFVMNVNWQALTLISDGVNWFVC